ncbi:MAG: class I SAM-dependent methyltransferase [Candidatus Izimaplasma sp.]|nr:class I SAM-dependent methyltransferase [Candidatus Izimaplasma bacterium]
MIYLTDLYKQIIKSFGKIDNAVDMTCGNGKDTLFLASISKKVYAFDIQETAIKNTQTLTKNYDNVEFIFDNHINIDKYITDKLDVVVYNLGYLPNGNKSITTSASSTLDSLKKVLKILNDKALVILEVYHHNPEEKNKLIDFTSNIDSELDVFKIDMLNKVNSPFLIIISKKNALK